MPAIAIKNKTLLHWGPCLSLCCWLVSVSQMWMFEGGEKKKKERENKNIKASLVWELKGLNETSHLSRRIQYWQKVTCSHSLTWGCHYFSCLYCADLTNTLPAPAESAAPAAIESRGWVTSGEAGSPGLLHGHGRASSMVPLLLFLGCLLDVFAVAGLLRMFSVKRIGCGGLGEINRAVLLGTGGFGWPALVTDPLLCLLVILWHRPH